MAGSTAAGCISGACHLSGVTRTRRFILAQKTALASGGGEHCLGIILTLAGMAQHFHAIPTETPHSACETPSITYNTDWPSFKDAQQHHISCAPAIQPLSGATNKRWVSEIFDWAKPGVLLLDPACLSFA